MAAFSSDWVVHSQRKGAAMLRLFCFPHAGSGTSTFRDWNKYLPPEIDVGYVQLPGRDGRRRDPPITNLSILVSKLADDLGWNLTGPVAFFGHSMGALISFELARELRRRALPTPVHLFVSSHRAPHLNTLNAGEGPLHSLSDKAFMRELQRRFGPLPLFAENNELVELFLPLLRADLSLCESYVYRPEKPLDCSISAFGGTEDRRVTENHLAAWQAHTARAFNIRTFPGDHFFWHANPALFLRVLNQYLTRVLRQMSSSGATCPI
jgi:medium-chain acyl-[acyl-carrier-protein] hydrolase